MYVNKNGHAISEDGDICLNCEYDGCKECMLQMAFGNFCPKDYAYDYNIQVNECRDFEESSGDDDGPGVDWWA